MNTRREEEAMIDNRCWPPGASKALAGEDGTFVAVVGTGPMKGHSWVDFEGSRDLHLN
jgi:hypothetical protein